MSGLQSDAVSSRRYDVAPTRSASGKIARHGNTIGDDSARPSTAAVRSSVRHPSRFEKLAEVAYGQMEGNSAHGVRFRRARPVRQQASCTFDQLDVPPNYDIFHVLES